MLGPTAVVVWAGLESWTTAAKLDERLAQVYPDVPPEDRLSALGEILRLEDEELVERRPRRAALLRASLGLTGPIEPTAETWPGWVDLARAERVLPQLCSLAARSVGQP